MMLHATPLIALFSALSVTASPIGSLGGGNSKGLGLKPTTFSLDFAVHLNLTLGGKKIADLDRARAAEKLSAFSGDEEFSRRDGSIPSTNTGVTYVTSVGIGEPATYYSLVVDTGSSNTWLGANQSYVHTSSSTDLGKKVSVSYGSGRMSGNEYNDTVTLSSDLVITQQSIGVANTTQGFAGYDGILGLGPVNITSGTVDGEQYVPTVLNNLQDQGKISSEILGVSFAPTTTQPNGNGVLNFGGPDSSKYTGDITYTPITTKRPANKYWGIDMAVNYGSSGRSLMNSTAGIVDTGSTLVLLPSDAFDIYTNTTGAASDYKTGLLKISEENYNKLESMYFEIGGSTFELTKNAQTFPRALNEFVGGDSDAIYLAVGDLGYESGRNGLDFILGYAFLERYYSVYDTTNSRVGFAVTENTNSTSN